MRARPISARVGERRCRVYYKEAPGFRPIPRDRSWFECSVSMTLLHGQPPSATDGPHPAPPGVVSAEAALRAAWPYTRPPFISRRFAHSVPHTLLPWLLFPLVYPFQLNLTACSAHSVHVYPHTLTLATSFPRSWPGNSLRPRSPSPQGLLVVCQCARIHSPRPLRP